MMELLPDLPGTITGIKCRNPFERASRGGGVFRFYRESVARIDEHRGDYAEIWQMPMVGVKK